VTQVGLLAEQPSVRLLKHIVRCYLRLSDNPRAREALRQCLPDLLRSPQFTACLKDDPTTCRCGSPSLLGACHSPCDARAHGQHLRCGGCAMPAKLATLYDAYVF
jgi:Cell differentiation family, Rcd1-like